MTTSFENELDGPSISRQQQRFYSSYVDFSKSLIDTSVNLHKLPSEGSIATLQEVQQSNVDVCAERGEPFLPVTAESDPDSKHIGLRDIWIPGEDLLQFIASQAKVQHLLLNIHRKLGVWNNCFRQDCMGMPTLLAPNPQDFI